MFALSVVHAGFPAKTGVAKRGARAVAAGDGGSVRQGGGASAVFHVERSRKPGTICIVLVDD